MASVKATQQGGSKETRDRRATYRVATRDMDKSVVVRILGNACSDIMNKRWLGEWLGDDSPHTWERHSRMWRNSANTVQHTLDAFLPRDHPEYSASKPSTQRRAPARNYPRKKEEDPENQRHKHMWNWTKSGELRRIATRK